MEKHEMPDRRFAPVPNMTIGEACVQASCFLEEAGVGEARANAELLLMHLLGLEKSALLRDWRDPFPGKCEAAWAELVERKAKGEPVQYIMGEQWFYGLPFRVTPAVLIPRPETELLVEAVLAAADRLWPAATGDEPEALRQSELEGRSRRRLRAVDVGTGSGAIAVTLAVQRPEWQVCATDLSGEALQVARSNAKRHGAEDRMLWLLGDLLEPVTAAEQPLAVDILISNPPYIPAGDIEGLQREVRDYEPRLALDGGEDGLNPYRKMLKQMQCMSEVPHIAAFELGQGQAHEVARMMADTRWWNEIRIIDDYAGIGRHVIALRTSSSCN
ncbi:peptide chain release factor N(5)-glutamine methyltransferase [Paenibacillus tarimensis]|uniref:peptide chain release factor N(5)-glutamine methyltransferase n=1 Tax=Paenibacillus tarimensis TaxID=416012 RepID=UPI001F22D293|nr:peptide chain release factor N(5)-glutamine methyltransferase [Paenibacillus tarimensis]MCF2944195.1 peptide chain release factor N(5)-glutamine methyltransferase [Paenibacillus tarimensis]